MVKKLSCSSDQLGEPAYKNQDELSQNKNILK